MLASWNDTPTKATIIDFVERVTDEDGPEFVPAAERIAVFNNDGTPWSEKPVYFQFLFAMNRVKALAAENPGWATTGALPSLALFVHHTDAEPEFAYDRDGSIGQLKRGLDEAPKRGRLLVDMAKDWKRVWPN